MQISNANLTQEGGLGGLDVDVCLLHPVGEPLRLLLEVPEDGHDPPHLVPLLLDVHKQLAKVAHRAVDVRPDGGPLLGAEGGQHHLSRLVELLDEDLPLGLLVEQVVEGLGCNSIDILEVSQNL